MTGRILYDLAAPDYHAAPALSAGGAWTLASECPALYWHRSPFNPTPAEQKNARQLDIGSALHLAVLEPSRLACRIAVIAADDWRTKEAREDRDAAHASGLIPLLEKDFALVTRLRTALLANPYVADLLDDAKTEVSYFWQAEGVDFKARADIVSRDGLTLGDLKASASAAPNFFRRQAFNAGHFLRSPFYMDGWEEVSGKRSEYFYIVVAREEPHLVTIARLDERAEAWGRMMIRRAMTLFRECLRRGVWPSYCSEPATLALPEWSEYRLADDEQAGRFDPKVIADADLRRAFELFAP